MVFQYLTEKVKDSKSPKTKTNIKINLVKEKDNWLIKTDDNLINAIIGNLEKAANILKEESSYTK